MTSVLLVVGYLSFASGVQGSNPSPEVSKVFLTSLLLLSCTQLRLVVSRHFVIVRSF
jgi:hypothetical protein